MIRFTRYAKFLSLQRTLNSFSFANQNQLQVDQSIPAHLKESDHIKSRFIGPQESDIQEMLKVCGANNLDHLVDLIIPPQIQDKNAINAENFPQGISESRSMKHLYALSQKNKIHQNYLGQGYYGTLIPAVIQRNVFENPAWYTAYTPYQGEISQGRLESLINYQTLVTELTGMDISNASLLDEATAAAEGMFLAYGHHEQNKKTFFADIVMKKINLFPQSLELLKSKAEFLGINLIIGSIDNFDFKTVGEDLCGIMVQSPDNTGRVVDFTDFFNSLDKNVVKIIESDLLALTITKSPRTQGAHIVLGNSQRFGVPLGYGGPHAAFLASLDEFKRRLPGRIIGLSKDSHGRPAYRMSLQTREQHIRREKATSNICTAQALLANMAAMYALYHGPQGLINIAKRVNGLAKTFGKSAELLNFQLVNPLDEVFDTVALKTDAYRLQQFLFSKEINVRQINSETISFSFDETHTIEQIEQLVQLLAEFTCQQVPKLQNLVQQLPQLKQNLQRDTEFLKQEIFNKLKSEHQLTRYMNYLVQKDISLIHSMITLGSCTMKLNPTSFMIPVSYPGFSNLHPYAPRQCAEGYYELVSDMKKWLCEVTGFSGMSFQPNSGAQGEYAGLLCIRKYHLSRGHNHRDICLIPTSAHGTNPASAVLAGLKVITVGTKAGIIDIEDLRNKVLQNKDNLAAIMITYPSTHGVYEAGVKDVIDLIHNNGGLVYMDGANMNAQSGLTSPGFLGADVCHLNLHKTFSIPHGGGGPGMGPIAVNKKLVEFLPETYDERKNSSRTVGQLTATRFGSASILPISYSYLIQLGKIGVRECSIIAMLNANYLMKNLQNEYPILYQGQNDMCAHEFILDIRGIKQKTGISEEDIAKRLMDYGFHAPTMSFPVAGTLMIEPTESEDKGELDRFIQALKNIREEIRKVENGIYDKLDNPLKNAPHTQNEVCNDEWNHKYTRKEAAFPLPYIQQRGKFWPSVSRIQNAYGDKNLFVKSPQKSFYQ